MPTLRCQLIKSRLTYTLAAISIFLTIAPTSFSASREVSCSDGSQELHRDFFFMAEVVEEWCTQQNRRQTQKGFPSCGTLCTDSLVRVSKAGELDLDITTSRRSSQGNSSSVTVTVAINLSVPLGPTDTLTCINPITKPELLTSLVSMIRGTSGSVRRACRQI